MNAEVIASLTTAGGTMVLAVATFVSTRSANRATRFAERSLLAGLRPVLMHAQLDDPEQKIGFGDDHWVRLKGPEAALEIGDDAVYLAVALRNIGPGMAVLQGWYPTPERVIGVDGHPPLADFRRQSRDLYIPSGDIGFWQGAFRDRSDEQFDVFAAAARDRRPIMVDLLYTDMHGGQRTITRFSFLPAGDDRWMGAVSRHWLLDGLSPRPSD